MTIDIGGHIGLNAVLFAQLAPKGKVYVFEPAPNTFKIIHERNFFAKQTLSFIFDASFTY